MASYYTNIRSQGGQGQGPQFNVNAFLKAGDLAGEALQAGHKRRLEEEKLRRATEREERQNRLLKLREDAANREVDALKVQQEVAQDFLNAPYAAKYGTGDMVKKADAAVLKDVDSRLLQAQQDPSFDPAYSPEEAAILQAQYETATPYQGAARDAIAGELVARGVPVVQANKTAESLTGNLLSKADEQKILDKRFEQAQKAENETAKLNFNILKEQLKNTRKEGSSSSSSGKKGLADIQTALEKRDIGGIDTSSVMDGIENALTAQNPDGTPKYVLPGGKVMTPSMIINALPLMKDDLLFDKDLLNRPDEIFAAVKANELSKGQYSGKEKASKLLADNVDKLYPDQLTRPIAGENAADTFLKNLRSAAPFLRDGVTATNTATTTVDGGKKKEVQKEVTEGTEEGAEEATDTILENTTTTEKVLPPHRFETNPETLAGTLGITAGEEHTTPVTESKVRTYNRLSLENPALAEEYVEQDKRAVALTNRYKNAASESDLSGTDRRWINDMRKSVNGRRRLKELGIPTKKVDKAKLLKDVEVDTNPTPTKIRANTLLDLKANGYLNSQKIVLNNGKTGEFRLVGKDEKISNEQSVISFDDWMKRFGPK